MKVLIVYATNTGNTYLVAQVVRDMLTLGNQVDLVNANECNPEVVSNYDLILLGSSSWDWQGKEGHPIQSMINFLESLEIQAIKLKKFVVFGCGDKDFKMFCGAVDKIEDFLNAAGGRVIFEPLKLDKFYIDVLRKIEVTKSWANELKLKLSTMVE